MNLRRNAVQDVRTGLYMLCAPQQAMFYIHIYALYLWPDFTPTWHAATYNKYRICASFQASATV